MCSEKFFPMFPAIPPTALDADMVPEEKQHSIVPISFSERGVFKPTYPAKAPTPCPGLSIFTSTNPKFLHAPQRTPKRLA